MSEEQRKKVPEEAVLIPAQTELRQRAVISGSSNTAYKKAIKAAEEAIEELSEEFSDWMKTEVDRLAESLLSARANGWNQQSVDEIFNITHDIKGQSTTLGYPIVTEIADTLCNLLEKAPDATRISLNVVDTFIQSIRTIIDQCDRNEDNSKANAISLGLRQMAMKILKHELNLANDQNELAEATETSKA